MNISHIYNFLTLIPKNKVVSYKTLSNIFLLHPRQIANILSQNSNQDIFPCYKVVNSNGDLGGYNLGIEEKIKRLKNDGIEIVNGKISKQYFWQPKLFNFFVAFPLEDIELIKFKNLFEELEKLNNNCFAIQKFESPHITLRFFGDLTLREFKKIVYLSFKNINKIKTNLKNQIINLNKLGNFHNKVHFFEPKSQNIINELKKFYIQYHKIISLSKEKRPYHPHLTILRVKNEIKFFQIKDQIENLLKQYKFSIKINKLRFYAAVDNNFQIPLIDINL